MAWTEYIKLGNNLLHLCIFIIVFKHICCEDEVCHSGLITNGYTLPRGDIVIKYGDPLDITCVLNESFVKGYGENASRSLYFVRDGKELPSEFVEVIDNRTAKLHIELPEPSNMGYTCISKLYRGAVCYNLVTVGVPPKPVTDFECIGYNYENLTCSWTPPENYVKTNYTLTYNFPGRRTLINSCSVKFDEATGKMYCFWNLRTNPHYRQAQQTYYFYLNATNKFGFEPLIKTFSHFAHVLSGPPENLTVVNTTSDSIYLRWSVPNAMKPFPPGLQHRVLYQSVLDAKQWRFGGLITTKDSDKKDVYFNLTGLKYAHMLYDIRVSLRSAAAINYESMWSNNASITVWTNSKEPGAPPRVTLGSFQFESSGNDITSRNVYIYWQQIPAELQNGEGFTYEVRSTDDSSEVQFGELKNSYVKLKNLSMSKKYKFLIWSKNNVGKSETYSAITIPDAVYEKVDEPTAYTKVAFGDGKYELSWEPPKNSDRIVNYTIFWCAHDRDRPYQCTGYLDWKVIPSKINAFNITVPDTKIHPRVHQFAISANTLTSSSGMVWAACTVIPNSSLGKMKNVGIASVGSNFIQVTWKLDCSDRIGSVDGFIIYYCPIMSPTERRCNGSQQNLTVTGNPEQALITDVKPYTTYMVRMAVKTKHSISQPSEALLNTTLEAAPTFPLNVKIESVTNSSITVSWEPPVEINGILKYYEIHDGTHSIKVDPKHETKYVFTNLTSYVYYNISMVACTIACSPPSKVKAVRTQVGYPGKIPQPYVSSQNDSYIRIDWNEPQQKRGENDLYEVRFKEKLDYRNKTMPIVSVTGRHYTIEYCGDDGKYNTFYVSVRAVNIVNGTRFEGPWSDELESYCQTPPKIVAYVLTPICVVLLLGLFYMAKKLYVNCQKMRDVEVKLPAGLNPVIAADIGPTHHWITQKPQEEDDPSHNHSPDEQLLLKKLSDRNSTRESSGHGSEQESVRSIDSSSRTATPSDSGTEQVNTSSTEEVNKTANLRFRKAYVSMPENTSGAAWPNKTNISGNSYCVLGVDPSANPTLDSSPPYVPVAISHPEVTKVPIGGATTNPHTPYVLTGDLNKPSLQGYVPLTSSTAADKNFTYVMAGNKPSGVPELMRLNSSSSTSSDDKLMYVQVADTPNTISKSSPESHGWHQPSYDSTINKLGYVSIGDAPPPITNDVKSGYYPHKNFEVKCLKED